MISTRERRDESSDYASLVGDVAAVDGVDDGYTEFNELNVERNALICYNIPLSFITYCDIEG
jgi:hypothetical protein